MGLWIGIGLVIILAGIAFVSFKKRQANSQQQQSLSLINKEAVEQITKKVKKTNPKAFKKQMRELENQCDRMSAKMDQLDQAINDYFGDSRISIAKFANSINGGIGVFEQNVERILSRINIFDQDGYEHIFKTHQEYSDQILPYQASFDAVDEDLKLNQEILARFDKLLMEVHKLSDPKVELSDLSAVQELDTLIDQTKLYRTQN
ncbi:MAG: hypothetical protein Q4A59_03870 [Erysipelotrichaceae bacterium]|nr:hypothetical protein [Erysipelotrichaceae bacterium]